MRDGMFLLFWWNAERLSVVKRMSAMHFNILTFSELEKICNFTY